VHAHDECYVFFHRGGADAVEDFIGHRQIEVGRELIGDDDARPLQ